MITFELTTADIENIQFGYSPLIELSTSFHILIDQRRHHIHAAWVEEALRVLHDVDLPYLSAVILPRYYLADFMTPTPQAAIKDLEDEFDRLRALPAETIREHVRAAAKIGGDTPIRQQFIAYPHETMECLIAEACLYWQRTLAHHWPRIRLTLDNDVLYRARDLALHGAGRVLSGLTPRVMYDSGVLRIDKEDRGVYGASPFRLDGAGLTLTPLIFGRTDGVSWQMEPLWKPMLAYTARGGG